MANNELRDPTKEGVSGLKGINTKEESNGFVGIPRGDKAFRQFQRDKLKTTPLVQDVGFVGIGDSRFDKRISTLEELNNIEETRAVEQSAVGQLANGIIKGAVLAGTTFLDGVVGLPIGIAQGIANASDDDENTTFWQGLWQNEFSEAMNSVNKKMEEIFENNYTRDELENPLAIRNIFSANFIGDKFLKNVGFTIGAFYSGNAFNSLLKATRLPSVLRTVTGSSRVPRMVMSGTGSAVSALNEGRVMALEDSNNWRKLQEAEAKDRYTQGLMEINDLKGTDYYNVKASELEEQYNAELERIQIDQAKMGNLEMLLNVPLLMASNVYQFGKLYANGFKTARKVNNLNSSKAWAVTKAIGNGLSEGFEEVGQGAISNISGLGYQQDVLDFSIAKGDPDAARATIDWMKATADGINATFNDSSTTEEFLIGTLTGLLGMPVFGKANTQDAWIGKGKSVGLAGGLGGELSEYNEQKQRIDKIVNYINDRNVNNKEFKNYYQGLVRHTAYQSKMDAAAAEGRAKDFKNAEFDQLMSDVTMFDNAGKIEDFLAQLDAAYDTSDENLDAIIENTTKEVNGKKVGPFIDSNGNKLTSTPEGKQKMIEQLTKSKDEIVGIINDYIKTKDQIDLDSGERLSDEELETLVSMKMRMNHWNSRIKEMNPEIKSYLDKIITKYEDILDSQYENIRDREHNEQVKKIEDTLNGLKNLRNASPDALSLMLTPTMIAELENAGIETQALDKKEAGNLAQLLKDTKDLRESINHHYRKFNEYVDKPEILTDELNKTYEKLAKTWTDIKIDEMAKEMLNNATDVHKLAEYVESIPEDLLPRIVDIAFRNATEEQKKVFQDRDDLDNVGEAISAMNFDEYSDDIKVLLANNIGTILNNADSKDDVFAALNALKETLNQAGNTNAVKAIDDVINNVNDFFDKLNTAEDVEAAREAQVNNINQQQPTPQPTPQQPQPANRGGLLGGNTTQGAPVRTAEEAGAEELTGVEVTGNTREEAMQNAVDKIISAKNNGDTDVIETIATLGVSNPNLTQEDSNIIKDIAKNTTTEEVITTPNDNEKFKVDEEINKGDIKANYKTNLNSSVVTEYTIDGGKNKKKIPYTPTIAELSKLQEFLKNCGCYNLIDSGYIGRLNNSTKNGIDINFIVSKEFSNTIFLATEVTPSFKSTVKVNYTPISYNGKEYAVLGVLKNNSSKNYSDIVEIIKEETKDSTTDWAVANSITKIKTFYSGRMVTSDENNESEERGINSVVNGKTFGVDYGFTIAYTNEDKHIGVDPTRDVIMSLNQYTPSDKRSGSLWLMSRGANGVWYPHYVSIARAGEIEWSNNDFFNSIRNSIYRMINGATLTEKLEAKTIVNNLIFFPDGNKISFADDFISIGGTKVNKVDYANTMDYVNAVIELIKSKNLRFQVTPSLLNNENTRESLINSSVLRTNLLQLQHINGSFDVYGLQETPQGTSIEHTGNREVNGNTRTNTVWFEGKQYDEYLEDGKVRYISDNTEVEYNTEQYVKLRVLSAVDKGRYNGIKTNNSTIYKVELKDGNVYYLEKPNQGPLKFITAQTYGRKYSAVKKNNQSELPPPSVGGLLGGNTVQGVAKPTRGERNTELQRPVESTTQEVKPITQETKPEVKPEIPAGRVLSRKDRMNKMRSRANNTTPTIDSIIRESQSTIITLAQSAGYNGNLSADNIKKILENNGISLDTITDKETLESKLEYIFNCKQ